MEVVLVLVGIAAVATGVIAYAKYADKKRKEELQKLADEMGLDFHPAGSVELQTELAPFNLFNSGRSKRLTKLIRGESDEVTISIFDYQYTTGSGKHSHTHYQTVAALQSPTIQIPDFTMRPENFMDKIGGMIGLQDIDFESHPKFSKMFVLKSSSEAAIRKLFNKAILEFFEGKEKLCVEANYGAVIIYRSGRFIKPSQIKEFLGEAYEVYGAIVDNL